MRQKPRGLKDLGFYSKCLEIEQQQLEHCKTVLQSSEVPLFVSSQQSHKDPAFM